MPYMYRRIESNTSFRSRLLGIVTIGIISLALTASVTTAWVTSTQARSQMVAQGKQITGSLAAQSVLALLFASEENAEKPLQAILSFPDVDMAGIFDTDGRPLLVLNSRPRIQTEALPILTAGPGLTQETATALYFVAPVFTTTSHGVDSQASPFQLEGPEKEFLGHVRVAMNKSSLREMQVSIFINNIAIGLSFALIIVFFLNLGIKRLTRPLYQLSEIMNQAEKEESHLYAELKGPREITEMAKVFNRMMTTLEERDRRLRRHREILQSEVAIRTQELVLARDAALTSSRHKSEFLANMSHELRTPLQAIIGYADVVREELELEGMEEMASELNRVLYNAQRLLSLINQILDLAKIEAGRMELRLQTVDLRNLVTEAVDTVLPILRQNGNRLQTELPTALEPCQIDREKLLQAILNLLSNAAKFTRNGTVTLELAQTEDLLKIQVTDTGIGLSREQQTIIFEEFRQVDAGATRKFNGTGLGLAITRRFCSLMGGSINVQSELGSGSTFTIFIPLPVRPAENAEVTECVEEPLQTGKTAQLALDGI